MNQEIHQILTDQFGVFEPELINTLADIGTIKSFEEGDELMRTGQYFKSTMLIVDGLVKLYREDDESNEFFVYFIEPGNACAQCPHAVANL